MAVKKIGNVDSVFAKYIVQCICENPLSFIPIIKTIMDPRNPDSERLHNLIAESIFKSVISDKDLKKKFIERIHINLETTTDREIFKLVNEKRVELDQESKKFLYDNMSKTIVALCEQYFSEKKKQIDDIFDDYFKTISGEIKKNMSILEKKADKVLVDEADKNSVNIHVPNSMRDKVVEYVKFLESQTVKDV